MPQTLLERRALLRHIADRLDRFGPLSVEARREVEQLADEPTRWARGVDLAPALESEPHFIISGWACQMRPSTDGGRQILGFLLPGDLIGSFGGPRRTAFFQTRSLTTVETLSGDRLTVCDTTGAPAHPALVETGRRAEEDSRRYMFEHMVRLGARDAYAGLAHLLLELYVRLASVGLAKNGAFEVPVGQRVLAQAMGFSAPHLNHTLQRLAADGLLRAAGASMQLLQIERIADLADVAVVCLAPGGPISGQTTHCHGRPPVAEAGGGSREMDH